MGRAAAWDSGSESRRGGSDTQGARFIRAVAGADVVAGFTRFPTSLTAADGARAPAPSASAARAQWACSGPRRVWSLTAVRMRQDRLEPQ